MLRGCKLPVLLRIYPTLSAFSSLFLVFKHYTLFSHTDKTFPLVPPHPDWYAAHCSKTPEKKKEKSQPICRLFPTSFHRGSRSSVSVCLLSQTQDAPGASVTRSYSAALPSASATGVNDHVFCCHSSRALDCFCRRSMPRQGFFYQYLSLSLFPKLPSKRARQAGRRASRQAGSKECLLQLSG